MSIKSAENLWKIYGLVHVGRQPEHEICGEKKDLKIQWGKKEHDPTNSILCKPKIANKLNNCNMPTQIAELNKYLNEMPTITVMTVPSAFWSFEINFSIDIRLFSTC